MKKHSKKHILATSEFSYSKFHELITSFQKNWGQAFRDSSKEQITPAHFESLEGDFETEYLRLKKDITVNSSYLKGRREYLALVQQLDNAKNSVAPLVSKARAISVSKWKDKDRSFYQTFLEFLKEFVKKLPGIPKGLG